jgi:dipeptidyl aminopeptidase/acylaminoacyl peptidase
VSVATATARPVATVPKRRLIGLVATSGGRVWSPDNGRSVYVRTRDEATKAMGIAKIDVASGAVSMAVEEAKRYGPDPFDIDAGPTGIVYLAEEAQHAAELWYADPTFTTRRAVTRLNPQLDRYTFGASRLIEWRSVDGAVLHGALLLPAGYHEGTRYPLLVDVYGGSYRSNSLNRFGLTGAGVDNRQLFATRGYAVLLPDAPLGLGTPLVDLAKTVLPGVDKVVELGIADPDRLGVMGHSYGGYSTLALITQTTRFRAAMASASEGDLFADYTQMTPDGGAWSIGWAEEGQGRMGGTPWQYYQRYLENSPFFHLDRVTTPLLLVHGGDDTAVPATLGDQTFVALRRLGKEVEYAKYAGEDHWEGTWSYANAQDYLARIVAWFDTHLKSKVSPVG